VAYKELREYSFGNEEAYSKEYLHRFQSEEAVKLDFSIGDNRAFFLQNAEVMSLAYQIAKLDKEIASECSGLPTVAFDQYAKRCLIDEIVLTNKIEGVHSSRKEIGEALDILENQSEVKNGKSSRFTGLVNKYAKLIHAEKVSLHSCEELRNIYDELVLEEVLYEDPANSPDGVLFRANPVSVYSETGKEIHRGLMPEEKIIEATGRALNFFNDASVEKLFRVCIFHYLLEYIHPFYDGNGRLGRFVLSYGISTTLTPLIAFQISETIKKNIGVFYKAIKSCNDRKNLGDITPFLLMQLAMLQEAMEDLKAALREKRAELMHYEKALLQNTDCSESLSELYRLLLQATLFSEMGISMPELEAAMGNHRNTIKKLMAEIPAERISVRKKGNNKYYSLCLDALEVGEGRVSLQR